MGNVAGEQGLALKFINFLILLNLQAVIKSQLLMMGPSNLALFIFSTCFFHFWHLLSYIAHNFMKSRSCDGLAANKAYCWSQGKLKLIISHSTLLSHALMILTENFK